MATVELNNDDLVGRPEFQQVKAMLEAYIVIRTAQEPQLPLMSTVVAIMESATQE